MGKGSVRGSESPVARMTVRYPKQRARSLAVGSPVRVAEYAGRLGVAVYVAAAFSVAAALIHLWVTPEHLEQWWAYGAFFLFAAAAQGLFAVLLLRWPAQPLCLAVIWGNLTIVVMYVVTRTYGTPFGPHVGKVEAAGLLDMGATAAELGLVIVLVTLLRGTYRRWTINALLLVGGAIWALRLAGVLP